MIDGFSGSRDSIRLDRTGLGQCACCIFKFPSDIQNCAGSSLAVTSSVARLRGTETLERERGEQFDSITRRGIE
jgi:hypothetical protein